MVIVSPVVRLDFLIVDVHELGSGELAALCDDLGT